MRKNKNHTGFLLKKNSHIYHKKNSYKKHYGLIIYQNPRYLFITPINEINYHKAKELSFLFDYEHEILKLSSKLHDWILRFEFREGVLKFEIEIKIENKILSSKKQKFKEILSMNSYCCLKNINKIKKCKNNIEKFMIPFFTNLKFNEFFAMIKLWISKNSKIKYKDYFKNIFIEQKAITFINNKKKSLKLIKI